MSDMTPGELGRAVARIESKVDKILDDHEKRIRDLERWRNAVPASVITSIAAVIVGVLR